MPKFVNLIAFLQKLISKEHVVVIMEFPDWVQVKIKAMLGMLGGGENLCGQLFMMELLPLGYHCMRT